MQAVTRHVRPADHVDAPANIALVGRVRSAARKARLYSFDPADPLVEVLSLIGFALGHRLAIYEPGARDISFDERWLTNLIDAMRAKDHDRYRFALLSRLPRGRAADLHFQLMPLANCLDSIHKRAT